MKIEIANIPRSRMEVLVSVARSSEKPTPRGIGNNVGDIRVTETAEVGGPDPQTRLTVSLGPQGDVTLETLRRAGGAAGRWLNAYNAQRAGVDVPSLDKLKIDGAVSAFCEGLALGAYGFEQYKSDRKGRRAIRVDLLTERGASSLRQEVKRFVTVADAVNLARDWAHEPPNVVNPVTLAKRVTTLARQCGLNCKVYDEKQLAKMKAGAILAVGGASKTPPRLIVLEHNLARQGRKPPVVLVGKAITFDTGGYSIKDKTGIVGMKYDKCGGTTVIGVLKAVAALKLKTPVVGIIAAAENMISGEAYRPNDIITTMNGKTVEIISTDAEGRLILADALTFAQKHYRPRAVIDLATLTGGVVVALGSLRAGLFANNDTLAEALITSGKRVHERLWRLPLDDDYLELIKGDDSDLKNSAGRPAHAIIGGMFLKQFVAEKTPWAHLDIAGVADSEKDLPYCPKGATGFGIRLLIDHLSRG